jgi:regulator of sigma E protease
MKNSLVRGLAILGGIIGLSTVILVHELGHWMMCKLYGVATPLFSVGFGPILMRIPVGETLVQLALLPIGGFVSIDPTDLAAQSYLTQVTIFAGGIAANLAAALLIFTLSDRAKRYTATLEIESMQPDSPAFHAGLKNHDTIIAFENTPLESVHDFIENIINHAGKIVSITIMRDGQTLIKTVHIAPEHPTFGARHGWIGIQLGHISKNKSWHETIISNTGGLFSRRSLIGPVGIIHLVSKSIAMGHRFFFLLLGSLNISIALFNLLPLPFLDGGKIVGITLERWTTMPGVDNYISFVSFAIIILLLVALSYRDIRGIIKRT